jgi:hypothetical protein
MKTWTKNDRVRGTALLIQDELRRTGRTRFEVFGQEPTLVSRHFTLRDKMKVAALLAIERISFGSETRYRLGTTRTPGIIAVEAGPKLGPSGIKQYETREFARFGLRYQRADRNGSDRRVLYFSALDPGRLLRA